MKKDIEAIRKEFRSTADARYFHRLHAVLLVLKGLSTVAAQKLLGDPQQSISRWVSQYREDGLNALRDAEKSGRPSVLNPAQTKTLALAVKKTPRASRLDGETWTGSLVSEFVKEKFGAELTVRHSRRLLNALQKTT